MAWGMWIGYMLAIGRRHSGKNARNRMTRLLRVWIGAMTLPALLALPASAAIFRGKPLVVEFKTSDGHDAGSATLTPAGNGVKVKLNLMNLPEGEHAIHVHQNAKCDPPDFKTAGGHLNPDSKEHGLKNPKGAHAGDMPINLQVMADGTDHVSFVTQSISLKPGAKNSVFANGGTAFIIHEKADDMMTDPTGNAGGRIACAQIVAP
jgi:Cu-Zn family superoxide dismutase